MFPVKIIYKNFLFFFSKIFIFDNPFFASSSGQEGKNIHFVEVLFSIIFFIFCDCARIKLELF